jgi:peptide/nickel transport system ATP-binding protein
MAQPVLNDISMSFYPGRTVAVVGESGSGKSTTARSLMGLLPPISGDILLNGEPLAPQFRKRSKAELKSVQMIYQMADTALNPKQRIRDIIGRPMTYYRGLKGKALTEETRALLADIELEPDQYMNRLPSELSGGQKQRIGIARALAAAPQLVICDEVTSALDQLVAEGILRLLDKLQKEHNLAYMFITHDISTVRAIADEVVVMQHGKIVEQGPKNAIFSPPHAPYTDLLLSSVPEMDPTWLDRVLADRVSEAARAYLVE